MGLSDVSNILWRERQLLELLLFKLEEEQLVLASGRGRWLNHAAREVEMVLEQIKHAELARSLTVSAVGSELGIGANPSLRELAERTPSPWNGIFEEHRKAFLTLTHEVQTMTQVNRELLAHGAAATKDALSWLNGQVDLEVDLYTAAGTSAHHRAGPSANAHLFNESL